MLSEMNVLTRLRPPMVVNIFLLILAICLVHEMCSPITKLSDLASCFLKFFDRFTIDLNINLVIRKSMYSLI